MNLEGVKLILPVYQKKDLLFTNLRGNSCLHFAVLTGQMKMAFAIMERASDLGILDELLALENKMKKTADHMLAFFWQKGSEHAFQNYLDASQKLFGGEEINKARAGQRGREVREIRPILIEELKSILGSNEIKEKTLKELLHLKIRS